MNTLNKIFLPLFPDDSYLKKKWWHRLVQVIAWTWFLYITLYFIFLKNFLTAYEAYKNMVLYTSEDISFWGYLWSPLWLSAIFYLPVAMFAVTFIYRIILYIAFGSKKAV
jgi:hypothetical protein